MDGKSTSKTVLSLGKTLDLQAQLGLERDDVIAWAKDKAKEMTLAEKNGDNKIQLECSQKIMINKNEKRSANVGYLFLKDIYHSLGIHKICKDISNKYKYTYDLDNVISSLCYARVLSPSSKKASFEYTKGLLEEPNVDIQHIYRGLEILAKENDFFQSQLYKNSKDIITRKTGVLYYDCTNYYFEIEDEDDFRKYGKSKEHRPNPIVQMGLFMDSDGIPLSFCMFNGNQNEQTTLTPLEEKIITDYGVEKFVVCTDAGLSSAANRKFNNIGNRGFVTTQPIKKLKGFLIDFATSNDGWRTNGSDKIYNLNELNEKTDLNKNFYKSRWINENGLEQQLIVTFSLKYRNHQRWVRNRQVERAIKVVENPNKATRNSNDYKRFVDKTHCTDEGEVAAVETSRLDEEKVVNEERFDGFYAVCTNLDDDPKEIIKINQRRWEIEESFRIIKSEFKARPVYLSRKDRITAHFITCFTALVIYRLLEKKLDSKYTAGELIHTLKDMNMLIVPGDGYIPTYKRTEITDALHETFGFRTDYQIVSQRSMKKILSASKR